VLVLAFGPVAWRWRSDASRCLRGSSGASERPRARTAPRRCCFELLSVRGPLRRATLRVLPSPPRRWSFVHALAAVLRVFVCAESDSDASDSASEKKSAGQIADGVEKEFGAFNTWDPSARASREKPLWMLYEDQLRKNREQSDKAKRMPVPKEVRVCVSRATGARTDCSSRRRRWCRRCMSACVPAAACDVAPPHGCAFHVYTAPYMLRVRACVRMGDCVCMCVSLMLAV
jgi:hypothetical protein